MKNTVRLSMLLMLVILASSCASGRRAAEQNTVMPLSQAGPLTSGSIVYGLPRTVFTITIQAERTIEKPGPYARYAGDLLGLNDVIMEQSEFWTIQDITVRSAEELDPSEFYVIKGTAVVNSNVLVLKKEGLILDLDPRLFDRSEANETNENNDYNSLRTFDLGSDEYFQMQRDTAYRRVNVDSSFIRIPYVVEKKRRLSLDQLADKAAKRLMELRDGKHLILTGEANVFPQSDAAIQEMNRLEKEYTELFTGKTWTESRTFTYHFIPAKEMEGNPATLFYFSDITGPGQDNRGGKAVTIELTGEKKTRDLVFAGNSEGRDEENNTTLFYRVPDVVNMKINLDTENLYNSRKLVYQFGEIVRLPSNFVIGR